MVTSYATNKRYRLLEGRKKGYGSPFHVDFDESL